MIALFVSDIDGCLSEVYEPHNLPTFQRISGFVGKKEPCFPEWSLCSGRSGPYVEAMAQVFGISQSVLFEAGAGMFNLNTGVVKWHPAYDERVEQAIQEVQKWLQLAIRGTNLVYDYGKRTQAGVVCPSRDELAAFFPVVERYIDQHYPELVAFFTPYSIDVVPKETTKADGLRWLSKETGIPLHKMAYIGDAGMDIGALKLVGFPFAPANAHSSVKALGIPITTGSFVEGVLEAYNWCVSWNHMKSKGRDTVPEGL